MRAFIILFLISFSLYGQVDPKPVAEADYALWSKVESQQLSVNGGWASYGLRYDSGLDTLFVKSTNSMKTYPFAGGTDGRFLGEQFFACLGKQGNLLVTNLKNSKQIYFPDVSNYSIAMGRKLLAILQKEGTGKNKLIVSGPGGKLLQTLPDVTGYSLNPAGTMLICVCGGKLLLVDLKKEGAVLELDATDQKYDAFAWQGNGASVACIAAGSRGKVGLYRLKEKTAYTFDQSIFNNFPKEGEIYTMSGTELKISDDGSCVFFGVKEKGQIPNTSGVQLWNTADKMLYPMKATMNDWTARPKLAVWFPQSQRFRMITDSQFPYGEVLPGQQFALVYNPFNNEPQFDRDAPIDFYLQNIATGEQQLILSKFSADYSKIGISGTGNFIAYFADKNWWVYDIKSKLHRNLTSGTGNSFTDENYDRSGEVKVFTIAGWTAEDKELLVCDNYDVWLLKTDGSDARKLTKGREEGIAYRVVPKSSYSANGSADNTIHLNTGLLLSATGLDKSGYYTWNPKTGLTALVFEDRRISDIRTSVNGNCTYIKEHYHIAPQLVVQDKSGKSRVLYQSNPQQKNYQWGSSKLVTYTNSKGMLLHGALFYPAGFDAERSYPMVVYIYERLSNDYNLYVNPSLLNPEGFNISNLTSQGYFVLLPDIAFEEGQPGKSALDCVSAAVNEVLLNESVDAKRVGLLGHSFGGYEVNFIVTQTNMFATVISGSGMSDIISSYLGVNWNNERPNIWRYEYNQNRIGVSLFDDYHKYVNNSPITFAKQVQTPILLWSGIGDKQIDYSQSLEFHMALRRLGKPNILLLYEREDHSFMERDSQIDLTRRIQQWFDYYLKSGSKPEWLTPDSL